MTYFSTTSFPNSPVQHQLVSARMEVQGLSPIATDGSLVLDLSLIHI